MLTFKGYFVLWAILFINLILIIKPDKYNRVKTLCSQMTIVDLHNVIQLIFLKSF